MGDMAVQGTLQPIRIYSTWGFHDELGDAVRLDESLCLRALDRLERWRDAHGMECDFFHVDCFWFDKKRPYDAFDPETFPNGPERVLRRVRELGLGFGLWFSANGGHMQVEAWEPSRSTAGWNFSLVDGPFADDLEAALHRAASEWGCRLFKFDFADWTASADPSRPESETRRRSMQRFRKIVRGLREAYPDAVLFAHCGFALSEQSTPSGSAEPLAADPAWLSVLDRLFSGDPHPIDVPQSSLARNLDLYQDRQVWALHQAGFPLERIDDHGALMGNTNTCAYRGRRGFPRTCLGQLARGGRRHLFYGDPEVLEDADVAFMKAAVDLYFEAFRRGSATRFVGDGEPGLAPWHGFLTGGGAEGLLYVVNPTFQPQAAELLVPGLDRARVLWTDGARCPVQTSSDLLGVQLAAEQSALVGLGRFADPAYELPAARSEPLPGEMRLADAAFAEAAPGVWRATWRPSAGAREVVLTAQAFDQPQAHARLGLPLRFAKQTDLSRKAGGPPSPSEAHRLVQLRLFDESGAEVPPVESVPDSAVWAGVSWVLRRFPARGDELTTEVRDLREARTRLRPKIFEIF